jgi:lipase
VTTLALHEWGAESAPRVVCLHGVTSHGRHFARLAATLAPSFHVLAPDLLGHGDSRWVPPWSLEEHLETVVETVGARQAALVGHSFGGRLAFELAARAPKLVPRLVLLDPVVALDPDIALYAAESARRERKYVSFEEGVERRYDESQLHHTDRGVLEEELRGHLVTSDDGSWRYRYSQAAVVAAFGEMARTPPAFAQVRVPTLLVLGEQSYLPYDHLLGAHRAALGDLLEVAVVPGGHTVLWDAFEESAAAVGRFLRGGQDGGQASA